MRAFHTKRRIAYDGTQLASHWAYRCFNIQGDSIVSFVGSCRVDIGRLVDLADAKAGAYIASPLMLHFICEHFGIDLENCVLRQRMLSAICGEILRERGKKVARRGDDLYYEERKLSVSIAAPTPVSCMMHFALNIETKGTPVPAAGLAEMKVDPAWLAKKLSAAYVLEIESAQAATTKVRGIP